MEKLLEEIAKHFATSPDYVKYCHVNLQRAFPITKLGDNLLADKSEEELEKLYSEHIGSKKYICDVFGKSIYFGGVSMYGGGSKNRFVLFKKYNVKTLDPVVCEDKKEENLEQKNVAFNQTFNPNQFVSSHVNFTNPQQEILKLYGTGEIIFCGRKISEDAQIVEAFKKFLKIP
jgi:hypothetical protein